MAFMGVTGRQLSMVVVMICGTFVTVLNQTLITPALPVIMSEFSIDASTAQWLTTGFTLVNAIMIPITAFFTDRFPVKRLFIIAMVIFTIGTAGCAWSPNFAFLLGGRLIQAAGAGILMPLVMTVMMWTFPIEQRGTAMGWFGLIVAFAPAIGPTVAGIVVDNTSWHNLFWAIVIFAAAMIVVSAIAIKSGESNKKDVHLDILSVILSCLGFGGLLYGLSAIGSNGFTIDAIIGLAAGAVILVFFFYRQVHMDQPMLQVRVLTNRTFRTSTIIIMIIQSALMAGSILLPIYLQTLRGFSATDTGLAMLPGAILTGVMGPIAGRLFDRYGPRALGITGGCLMVASTICVALFSSTTSFAWIVIVYTVRMFSISLINMPLNTWGMNALPRELMNHGTSVNNTFRQVAGSLGTAILVSVYTIVAGMSVSSMGETDASIFGFDITFGVATALCAIALIMIVFMVKNKKASKESSEEEKEAADVDNARRKVIEDIMKTDVYTIPETATVREAMQQLVDKHISALPVVNDQDEAVGFISDGDIMRHLSPRSQTYIDPISMIDQTISEDAFNEDFASKLDEILAANVLSIGVKNVISVGLHDDLDKVCRVLGENHLKKVVVAHHGKLVGVINRSDVTRYTMQLSLAHTPDELLAGKQLVQEAKEAATQQLSESDQSGEQPGEQPPESPSKS